MTLDATQQLDKQAQAIATTLTIPPCPEVIAKIVRESHADDPDLKRIGLLVSQDIALAATLLQTVNSPFYGLRSPIHSIHQALMMLGLRTVKSLVMALLLRQAFPKVNSPGMQRFWRDSARNAALGTFVARSAGRIDKDLAYTYGLFRHCGMPILRTQFDAYEPIIARSVSERRGSLITIERKQFGIDHAVLGAKLAGDWHLGPNTCEAIRHDSEYPGSEVLRAAAPKESLALVAIGVIVDWIDDRIQNVEPTLDDEFDFALECLDISSDAVEVMVLKVPEALAGVG